MFTLNKNEKIQVKRLGFFVISLLVTLEREVLFLKKEEPQLRVCVSRLSTGASDET